MTYIVGEGLDPPLRRRRRNLPLWGRGTAQRWMRVAESTDSHWLSANSQVGSAPHPSQIRLLGEFVPPSPAGKVFSPLRRRRKNLPLWGRFRLSKNLSLRTSAHTATRQEPPFGRLLACMAPAGAHGVAIRSPKCFIFAESAPKTAGFRGCGLPRRRLWAAPRNDKTGDCLNIHGIARR